MVGPFDDYGDPSAFNIPIDADVQDEKRQRENALLAERVAQHDAEDAARQEAEIRASLTPMGMAGGAGRAADAADTRGDSYLEPLMSEVVTPSRPNPVAPIRKAHADATLGQRTGEVDPYGNAVREGGNLEAIGQARTDVVGAQVYEQAAMADAYAREAGAQQAQIDAQQAKLVRDEQRRQRAIEAQDHVFKQVQDATDKLLRTPEVDQGRYWASRKGYQKVAWAISAIADGLRGLDPMGALNRAIEQDLGVQQANYAQTRSDVEAAQGQLGAARSLYADLRQTIGDEDVAANALRIARYEQAKAMVMAEQMRNGIPLTVAQGSVEIAELDQKISDLRMQTSEKVAITPERVGGGRRPLVTGAVRKTMERLQEGDYDEARALRARSLDMGGEAARQERGAELDMAKDRNKAELAAGGGPSDAQRKLDQQQRQWLVKETASQRKEQRLITQFQEQYKDEIPGLVWGLGWQRKIRTDESVQAFERLKRIVMVRLRRESGAAIPETELENDASALLYAMDEDDVRNMLNDRLAEVAADIDMAERAPEQAAVEEVNRGASAPRAPLSSGGAGLPDPVDWSDED